MHDLPPAPFVTHEEVYTPAYCLQLEAAYGPGMMSEGGEEAIEQLFSRIDLKGKTALDIGCGFGGVAFYLADHYGMRVMGLDVNRWLVEEAKRRTPEHLKGKVEFCLSTGECEFPFPDESFDIIYSKGVLVHIESKEEIFRECHRVLKPGGFIIVNDWLSSEEKRWGVNVAKLVELEKLVLYPEGVQGYTDALKGSGFQVLDVSVENELYIGFNKQIIARLEDPSNREELLTIFGEKGLADAIEGYQAIMHSQESGETYVMRFVAQKK